MNIISLAIADEPLAAEKLSKISVKLQPKQLVSWNVNRIVQHTNEDFNLTKQVVNY
jgi:hypothetical protein